MVTTRNQVWLAGTAAVFGSLLYFYFDPSRYHFFPPCPFYTFSGLFCPGCGSQRALHDLMHGHILHAAGHNLLLVLFLPLLLFAAAATLNNIFRDKKIGQRIFTSSVFTWATLTLVLMFWLLRNIPLTPFSLLAP